MVVDTWAEGTNLRCVGIFPTQRYQLALRDRTDTAVARYCCRLMAVPVGGPLQWAAGNSLDIAFDTEVKTQLQSEVHHAAQEMFVGSGNRRGPVGIDCPCARLHQ
ncbi:hypothetical protein D3C76_1182940 [compost metagenome]